MASIDKISLRLAELKKSNKKVEKLKVIKKLQKS